MFVEDHAAFFELNGHAVTATFYSGSSPGVPVVGIFNDEYFDEVGGMVDVEGSQPMFTCAAADVPGVVHGDKLIVDGQTHNIKPPKPDGTGQITLILEKVDPLEEGEVYSLDFSKNYNSQYIPLL